MKFIRRDILEAHYQLHLSFGSIKKAKHILTLDNTLFDDRERLSSNGIEIYNQLIDKHFPITENVEPEFISTVLENENITYYDWKCRMTGKHVLSN
jgi:mRNA degradation ribonuclease J1/J2